MAVETILVIDDETLIRNFISETLKRKGFQVVATESGEKGLVLLEEHPFDLVITDMKMGGMSGMEFLKRAKILHPATLIIVITAFGTIENAVEAMSFGAFNYVIKPFTPETIETLVQKASEQLDLIEENQALRRHIGEQHCAKDHFIAESPQMKKLVEETKKIAQSNANVLIHGESGTGKEVFAQLIHSYSKRSQEPFVKINCAAVPDTLIESEFFGHEKGSFTGALYRRLGYFELADQGSLLLDEITEFPSFLQAKLLRAIQEGVFERVGGSESIKVDVRIISTSNRSLQEAIHDGTLREDLYYRLNVIPLYIPPLRERPEDILPLADYFLHKFCQENGTPLKHLTKEAKTAMCNYDWPGNVRELANIIERSVVLTQDLSISQEWINLKPQDDHFSASGRLFPSSSTMTLQEMERRWIEKTLRAQKNNCTQTAKLLGISTKVLRNKLERYNLISHDEK